MGATGEAGSGATAQPDGSLTFGSGAAAVAGELLAPLPMLLSDHGAADDELLDEVVVSTLEPAPTLSDLATVSRARKAVTSLPVDTMLITDQPSADFSVSCGTSADGSNDDERTVVNSCMVGDGTHAPPRWERQTQGFHKVASRGRLGIGSADQPLRTRSFTSALPGGPSKRTSPSASAINRLARCTNPRSWVATTTVEPSA